MAFRDIAAARLAERQERLRDRRDQLNARLDQRINDINLNATGNHEAIQQSDPEFDKKAEEAIPAVVRMISGCKDEQTSADVSNVTSFQLPDAAGKAGGALTSALLSVIYKEEEPSSQGLSFVDVFIRARDVIKRKGFEQIPQLSSSRNIDVNQPFDLMSNVHGNRGQRHAVLIGINYERHIRGRLSGCHNDVKNMKKYIVNVGMFDPSNIVVLMDDGKHLNPTKENILNALDRLCDIVQPGDTAFVHYSGHGGRVRDLNDPSGYSSTLVPLDFDRPNVGHILDKQLYSDLVCAMPKETSLTCIVDACHSGSILDLPYTFVADGTQTEMTQTVNFPFLTLLVLTRERRQQRREDRRNRLAARREMLQRR